MPEPTSSQSWDLKKHKSARILGARRREFRAEGRREFVQTRSRGERALFGAFSNQARAQVQPFDHRSDLVTAKLAHQHGVGLFKSINGQRMEVG